MVSGHLAPATMDVGGPLVYVDHNRDLGKPATVPTLDQGGPVGPVDRGDAA